MGESLDEASKAAIGRLPLHNAEQLLAHSEKNPDENAEAITLLRQRIMELAPSWSNLFGIDPDFPDPGTDVTGKVYLAYEWTEEREGKIHIAVCSTVDKAKEACQRRWDDDQGGPTPLQWSLHESTWVGEKPGSQDEDYPYEVEEFDLDTVSLRDPQAPRFQFKKVRL